MKKLFAALALVAGASAVPAIAGNVAVSISVGEPGFYGHLDVGGYGRPALVYHEPAVVVKRYRGMAPVYMRVPADHSRNWNRYCGRYDACSRPVYFVRDEWYRNVYSPRYRQLHQRNWNDSRRDDHRWDAGRGGHDRRDDRWHDDRRNDRNDRGGRDDRRYDGRGGDHDRYNGRGNDHRDDRGGHGQRDDRGGHSRGEGRDNHGGGHDSNRGGQERGGRRT